jgi:uncharacterized protein YjbJ (UPF0337 family)
VPAPSSRPTPAEAGAGHGPCRIPGDGSVDPFQPQRKEFVVNKDQVQGRATQAKGDIKQAAGKAVGSRKLQVEGLADQARGKAQSGVGAMKKSAKDLLDKG